MNGPDLLFRSRSDAPTNASSAHDGSAYTIANAVAGTTVFLNTIYLAPGADI